MDGYFDPVLDMETEIKATDDSKDTSSGSIKCLPTWVMPGNP